MLCRRTLLVRTVECCNELVHSCLPVADAATGGGGGYMVFGNSVARTSGRNEVVIALILNLNFQEKKTYQNDKKSKQYKTGAYKNLNYFMEYFEEFRHPFLDTSPSASCVRYCCLQQYIIKAILNVTMVFNESEYAIFCGKKIHFRIISCRTNQYTMQSQQFYI